MCGIWYSLFYSIPKRYETFWKELDYVKNLWKNRSDLKVEDAGIAALFGLECFAWYCAGEISGRGFTFTGYYPWKRPTIITWNNILCNHLLHFLVSMILWIKKSFHFFSWRFGAENIHFAKLWDKIEINKNINFYRKFLLLEWYKIRTNFFCNLFEQKKA